MRSALFWDFTQQRLVECYQCPISKGQAAWPMKMGLTGVLTQR
jgi:hypothetical protein